MRCPVEIASQASDFDYWLYSVGTPVSYWDACIHTAAWLRNFRAWLLFSKDMWEYSPSSTEVILRSSFVFSDLEFETADIINFFWLTRTEVQSMSFLSQATTHFEIVEHSVGALSHRFCTVQLVPSSLQLSQGRRRCIS